MSTVKFKSLDTIENMRSRKIYDNNVEVIS